MLFQKKAPAHMSEVRSEKAQSSHHYGNWPNDAGFNAHVETLHPVELVVKGEFPNYVAGTLLRAGPGRRIVPREDPKSEDFKIDHWFDGFSHIHKFELKPSSQGGCSSVLYSSRNQVDEAMEVARKTGKLEGFSFAQKRDPCDSLYKKMKTIFEPQQQGPRSANISVTFQPTIGSAESGKRQLTATTDKNSVKNFDLETLEPLGVVDQSSFHPQLMGQLSGAHACIDDKTGYLYNYNLLLGPKITYRVFETELSSGNTKILATISDPRLKAAYIHSMFMTDNYLVLCVWPAFISRNGIKVLWEKNILDAMEKFDPSQICTWFVIDRRGTRGVISKFQSPAMFSFHTVNAWEEENSKGDIDLICELCTFKDTTILHRFYYENLVSNAPGVPKYRGTKAAGSDSSASLTQFRLSSIEKAGTKSPLANAQQVFSLTSPLGGDLPTFNPAYKMRKHRYVYSAMDTGLSSFIDSIGKTDTLSQTARHWSQQGCTPSEPIFVPRPDGQDEDDGVLLSVVLNGITGSSFLLCLDAKDLKEMGRADCNVAVGLGYHGIHLPRPIAV